MYTYDTKPKEQIQQKKTGTINRNHPTLTPSTFSRAIPIQMQSDGHQSAHSQYLSHNSPYTP